MINEAIRAIVDLLKIKKDAKKADLEIQKLEREKAKSQSVIGIATTDDIKKYDPRVARLERFAREQRYEAHHGASSHSRASKSGGWFSLLVVSALVAFALYRCAGA